MVKTKYRYLNNVQEHLFGILRDEPFNIYRGVPKNDKEIVCRRKKLEKNCLQIVCPEKNCLHGNLEDFENFTISACSKDAFLLHLTRQHSITFWYKF